MATLVVADEIDPAVRCGGRIKTQVRLVQQISQDLRQAMGCLPLDRQGSLLHLSDLCHHFAGMHYKQEMVLLQERDHL